MDETLTNFRVEQFIGPSTNRSVIPIPPKFKHEYTPSVIADLASRNIYIYNLNPLTNTAAIYDTNTAPVELYAVHIPLFCKFFHVIEEDQAAPETVLEEMSLRRKNKVHRTDKKNWDYLLERLN